MSQQKSPFKFLSPYTKKDKDIYFGRDEEINQLYQMVSERSLVLVYGASGTGKSSLVRSGLAKRFRDTDWFDIFIQRRKTDINEVLHQNLYEAAKSKKKFDQCSTLSEKIRSVFLDYFRPIFLIFDQFEELFIEEHGATQEERKKFSEDIAELLAAEQKCTVIFVIREEYIARLHEFEKNALPHIFDKRLRVEPMSTINVEEVITKTCEKYGILLNPENETLDEIIAHITDEKFGVQLPFLQIYLDKLYQNAQSVHNAIQDKKVNHG